MNHKFKANLGYIGTACLKNQTNKQLKRPVCLWNCVCFLFFETRILWLPWNSCWSGTEISCLCLLRAGVKGARHHCPALGFLLVLGYLTG